MIDQGTSLAAIEGMIAHHTAMIDALIKVRELMTAATHQPVFTKAKPLQLTGPPKKRKRRSSEPVIHEVEGVDVEVTPLQDLILEALAKAPDAMLANDLAKQIGNITPAGITYAIKDLRERLKKAGCKAEVNGYRGKGFRLEVDRGD